MTSVLLCGAFGQENPGDDALLDAFLETLDRHELLVASPTTIGRSRAEVVAPTPLGVHRALARCDAVVIAGGTIFKTLHPSTGRHPLSLLARTRMLLEGARLRGIPFAAVGVGAGSLRSPTAKRLTRSIAERADLLILRDEESAAVLDATGAHGPFRIGADPAWMLFDGRRAQATAARDGVVVAVSHLADDDTERLVERISHVVEPLVVRGEPVELQPWQPGADQRVAVAIRDRLAHPAAVTVGSRPTTIHDAARRFATARAVIGLRHHSLVAAAISGTPFLALSHEPKLAGLARRLGQPDVPVHAGRAVLARAAVSVLDADPADRAAVLGEIAAARRAMRLLRLVVCGGQDDDLVDEDQLTLTAGGVPW